MPLPSPHHIKWHRMCLGCSNCVMQGLVVIMLHNNAVILPWSRLWLWSMFHDTSPECGPALNTAGPAWHWGSHCHPQESGVTTRSWPHGWHPEKHFVFYPFLCDGSPIVHLSLSPSCKQNVSPLSRKQFAGHCKINSEKEKTEEKITLWPFLVLSLFSAWCFS